jgi:hypothetical protein
MLTQKSALEYNIWNWTLIDLSTLNQEGDSVKEVLCGNVQIRGSVPQKLIDLNSSNFMAINFPSF